MSTTPAAHLLNYGPTNKAPIKLIVSARNTRAVITLMTATCKLGGADIQMSLISIHYRPGKKFTSQSTVWDEQTVHQTIGRIPIKRRHIRESGRWPCQRQHTQRHKKTGPNWSADHLRRPKVKKKNKARRGRCVIKIDIPSVRLCINRNISTKRQHSTRAAQKRSGFLLHSVVG
jgi:hypothetical protein